MNDLAIAIVIVLILLWASYVSWKNEKDGGDK